MGEDNAVPSSKKRAAGREISRDNPGIDDEEDVSETETGTFKKASDEVIASRRIVKVRRQQTASTIPAPSSNPFAGIRLVPPVISETKNETHADSVDKINSEADEKADSSKEKQQTNGDVEKEVDVEPSNEKSPETNDKEFEEPKPANDEDKSGGGNGVNEDDDKKEKKDDASVETTPFSSFQQLSSNKNAFSGFAGSGFSSTTFSFGSSVSKDGSSSAPSFSFGTSSNGGTSLFGSTGNKSESTAFPSMQEVPLETGEEHEDTAFTADSALFEFLDGGWKERGKGEIKLNVSNTGNKKSRLVMRARGNYRLILNASLFSDMKLTKMDKKGITFACVNSATEGKTGLATFALKFKDVSLVETFCNVVEAHKGEVGPSDPALETLDNSPDAAAAQV